MQKPPGFRPTEETAVSITINIRLSVFEEEEEL